MLIAIPRARGSQIGSQILQRQNLFCGNPALIAMNYLRGFTVLYLPMTSLSLPAIQWYHLWRIPPHRQILLIRTPHQLMTLRKTPLFLRAVFPMPNPMIDVILPMIDVILKLPLLVIRWVQMPMTTCCSPVNTWHTPTWWNMSSSTHLIKASSCRIMRRDFSTLIPSKNISHKIITTLNSVLCQWDLLIQEVVHQVLIISKCQEKGIFYVLLNLPAALRMSPAASRRTILSTWLQGASCSVASSPTFPTIMKYHQNCWQSLMAEPL